MIFIKDQNLINSEKIIQFFPFIPQHFHSLILKSGSDQRIRKKIIVLGAYLISNPVGLVFGFLDHNKLFTIKTIKITQKAHNRFPFLYSSLITKIEEKAIALGADKIKIQYTPESSNNYITNALVGFNWTPPVEKNIIIMTENVSQAVWLDMFHPPEKYDFIPWKNLKKNEKKYILNEIQRDKSIPENLKPLENENYYDSSILLRIDNSVKGWLLTKKISNTILLYDKLFLHQDIRGLGTAVIMLSESIKIHYKHGFTRGLCTIAVDNIKMIKFFRKMMKDFIIYEKTEMYSEKRLPAFYLKKTVSSYTDQISKSINKYIKNLRDKSFKAILTIKFTDNLIRYAAQKIAPIFENIVKTESSFANQMATVITLNIIKYIKNILKFLRLDIQKIDQSFPEKPTNSRLLTIKAGFSDPHNNFQTVAILEFENNFKIVYKPRNMDIDQAFYNFLIYLGIESSEFNIKIPRFISSKNHSWCEFFSSQKLTSKKNYENYYYTMGVYLAIFHCLDGDDFHDENFLVNKNYVFPCDLECLMTGCLTHESINDLSKILKGQEESVLHTKMLPLWYSSDKQHKIFFKSGINLINTDNVNIDFLIKGFQKAALLIKNKKSELTAHNSPLDSFKGFKIRFINRTTGLYYKIFYESLNSENLKSKESFCKALEEIKRYSSKIKSKSNFEIPSISYSVDEKEEIKSLLYGDIPICHALTSKKGLYINGFKHKIYLSSILPLSRIKNRIKDLDKDYIDMQSNIIRASILMATPDKNIIYPDTFAEYIGNQLCRLAIKNRAGVSWLSLTTRPGSGNHLSTHFTVGDLANGTAGVALFSANLYKKTKNQKYSKIAIQALEYSIHYFKILDDLIPKINCLSAFTGIASLIYSLTMCSKLLDDEYLLDRAFKETSKITFEMIQETSNPDLMTGLAGSLSVFINLYNHYPDKSVYLKARAMANKIVLMQLSSGGWQIPGFKTPLLGAAHGAVGIAMSLSKLYKLEKNIKILDSIKRALAFEADKFDKSANNWPNLQIESKKTFMRGWCGGPAGAGLARIIIAKNMSTDSALIQNTGLIQDIEYAIQACLKNLDFSCAPPEGHHLCCGYSGISIFLVKAAEFFKNDALKSRAKKINNEIIQFYNKNQYLCLQAINSPLIIPGLLNGISGLGLAQLIVKNSCDPKKETEISNPLTLD